MHDPERRLGASPNGRREGRRLTSAGSSSSIRVSMVRKKSVTSFALFSFVSFVSGAGLRAFCAASLAA